MAEEKTTKKKITKEKTKKQVKPVAKEDSKKKTTKKVEKKTTTKKKTSTTKKIEKKQEPKTKEIKKAETAKKPAAKKKVKPKTEEEIEEKTEEEEEKYIVKKKPDISKEIKLKLVTRKKIKQRTPNFIREEWFRYKRIPHNWRRPDGITSKMRKNLKYRPSKVRVGFRGPGEVRGLHPSGFEEVFVFNIRDLDDINPKTQAARIGGTVGMKKRSEIMKKAEKLDIRIINM